MKDWNTSLKTLIIWWLPLSIIWGMALWFCVTPGIGHPDGHHGELLHWYTLCLLGIIAIGASIIDWRSKILPDIFTLYMSIPTVLACMAALAYRTRSVMGWENYTWEHQWNEFGWIALTVPAAPVIGAVLGFILLKTLQYILQRRKKGQEQMGGGDVKLMIPLGALVGAQGLIPLVGLACIFVWGIAFLRKSKNVSFGPALTLAAIITVLVGLRWPL